MLSVALSLRAQEKGKHIVDGVLLFAPPLVGFGMQYAITQHMDYGPALSALGYGAFYMALAWLALRRYPSMEGRWCWRRSRWVARLPPSPSRWRFRRAGRQCLGAGGAWRIVAGYAATAAADEL
ncbi:Predicted membrane protein [Citrobacter koseri]|uniref:Predicted membrane protein n=1 Tax=Citrobacter koseri TaxID=545 RepID=A0A2X2UTH2_CITKO|nr:Predicted membrane protein [Citrobacter koseri]